MRRRLLHRGHLHRDADRSFATDLAPAELRASAVGWCKAAVGLLGLLAGIVACELWNRVGHAVVCHQGAASAAAGCVTLLVWMPNLPAGPPRLGKAAAVV